MTRPLEPAFAVDELSATTPSGQRVAIWGLRPAAPRRVVVIGGGMARSMPSFAPFATYLAANGSAVYRFDSVNNVGLSDGEIEDFQVSDLARSLEATVAAVRHHEGTDAVVLVPVSLTARPAFRLASRDRGIAAILSVVGVVNFRATMAVVFGIDYAPIPERDLPEFVPFEKLPIRGPEFWRDAHEAAWWEMADTRRDVDAIEAPVIALSSREDSWVSIEDVRAVIGPGASRHPRVVYELPYAGHDLGVNLAAARRHLNQVVTCLADLDGDPRPTVEPPHQDLIHQVIWERRLQRSRQAGQLPLTPQGASPA
jgi:acyl transferase